MGTVIILNGKSISSDASATIAQLLTRHAIDPDHVVVEVNRVIISRDQFACCSVHEGDVIEVLRFVGGG